MLTRPLPKITSVRVILKNRKIELFLFGPGERWASRGQKKLDRVSEKY